MIGEDRFIVLSFFGGFTEISSFRVNFPRKEIIFLSKKIEKYDSLDELKKIFSLAFFPRPYGVIFNFDSEKALTIYQSIAVERDNPKELLTEAELDNLISQALWQIYDEGRREAVKRWKAGDLNVILAETLVYDCRIDNRRLLNPLNQRGRRIEFRLKQTFVSRSFWEKIRDLLPRRAKSAVIFEKGTVATHLISKHFPNKDFLFFKIDEGISEIFVFRKSTGAKISYLASLEWGKANFFEEIENELGIGRETTNNLIKLLIENKTSVFFAKRFREILVWGITPFFKKAGNIALKAQVAKIFIDFSPFGGGTNGGLLPGSGIFSKIILPVNSAELINFFGFNFKNRSSAGDKPDFTSLAAILELYFLPKEDLVNHLAKRRMRWLMPKS